MTQQSAAIIGCGRVVQAGHGRDVLPEKPLTISIESTTRIAAVVEESASNAPFITPTTGDPHSRPAAI